jgi:YVTN family beta-propeller protein
MIAVMRLRNVMAVVVGAVTACAACGGGSHAGSSPSASARGGPIAATIPVGDAGGQVAIGFGSVWIVNTADGSVSRIDPAAAKVVATIRVGSAPFGVAAGEGAVWVANQDDDSLSRIDPATNRVARTVPVGMLPIGVAVTPGAVWVANHHGDSVMRVDPKTNKVVRTVSVGSTPIGGPAHMAADARSVWVGVPDVGAVVRIDATANTVRSAKIPSGGGLCGDLALAGTAVWVAGGGCAVGITRVDPSTGKITATLLGKDEVAGLALEGGVLWYTALEANVVGRIDTATNTLMAPVEVPGTPRALAVGFGSVWVGDPALGAVLELTPN